ncbi:diguanylate cyclase [Aurantimonas sp. C2-6-R+9]|uniref:GGDEF domain-containing protein n=1 Tax=unclassified Aurantimonas TaxID=2638230 RepID=UPI002E192FAE|nr:MULTISPECIES: diguanylate cyclase [unclassified Aurantimonas]MEC5293625.1 diguanylate cyclase [Aurantimonas sp. C2-3-R2]MEC5383192.1 diguanylate cyclase [Aurantimonas sp. C2-6-R+9]MEC5414139.1 diguanylate cyclase [Aurantimonas sp. C2-4-R8]
MSLRTTLKTAGFTFAASSMAAALFWSASRVLDVSEGFEREVLLPFLVAATVASCFLFPWIRTTHRLQNVHGELERVARTDMLTGLANRWAFFNEAEAILSNPMAGRVCAVLMIDLDHFKLVNDTKGHAAGDKVPSYGGNWVMTV